MSATERGHDSPEPSADLPAERPGGSALAELEADLDDVELRPALVREYSSETLKCYARRLRRYQAWCGDQGYQGGTDRITTAKLEEYVQVEVKRRELRPPTLRQAVNALLYYAERAGIDVPDDREAKELVRRYEAAWAADGIPPTHRVPGRRSPRPKRAGG